MASKANKGKTKGGIPEMPVYEPSTTLRVNTKKFKSADGYDVGDKCKFIVEGEITSITKNEDYEDCIIEVTKIGEEDEDGER